MDQPVYNVQYVPPVFQQQTAVVPQSVTFLSVKRDPLVACLIALIPGFFIPGCSYLYLGQTMKFVYFLILQIINILLAWLPILGLPLYLGLWIYMAIDSYMLANRTTRGIPIAKGESTWIRWPLLDKLVKEPVFASDSSSAPVEYTARVGPGATTGWQGTGFVPAPAPSAV